MLIENHMATDSSSVDSIAFESSSLSSSSFSSSSVSLTLVTWNINKNFPRGVREKGHAKRRDVVIPAVLDYLDEKGKEPDVLLFQESPIRKRSARSKWGLSSDYEQQYERKNTYQGIDTTHDLIDMDSLSEQIDKLVPEGKTDDKDALKKADKKAGFPDDIIVDDYKDRKLMRSDIPPRAFARKLEVSQNGTETEVIVVSFHSVYKNKRKRFIKLFFNLMCRLAQIHECLVLVGADFNLNVGDWRDEIQQNFEDHRVKVAKIYQPTPRRDSHNIIDTFAVVYPPGKKRVECTLSEPCAYYPFPDYVRSDGDRFKVVKFTNEDKESLVEQLPETCRGDPKWKFLGYDLDHDPILVTAELHITD